jgi:hypothetical protein
MTFTASLLAGCSLQPEQVAIGIVVEMRFFLSRTQKKWREMRDTRTLDHQLRDKLIDFLGSLGAD